MVFSILIRLIRGIIRHNRQQNADPDSTGGYGK